MPRSRKNIFKVNDEILKHLVGRWKIQFAQYRNDEDDDDDTRDPKVENELTSVEFTLDGHYDVTWHVPVAMETNRLFQTTSFEIDDKELTLRGCPDGTSFVFFVDMMDDGIIELFLVPGPGEDGLCIYIKKALFSPESVQVFSLLNALKENYFSDLSIKSSDGKKFEVHRCILSSSGHGIKYREWEMLLSGLSSEALDVTLHYVYSSSLPAGVKVDTAKELSDVASRNPKLSHLKELCLSHIESLNLNKRLQELVDSLVQSLDVVRQIIVNVKMDDPAKVVYAIKQLFRETAAAGSRFILLSHLYAQNKKEMSKREKREILEYVQARIIVFIDGARELIQLSIAKWESLTEDQRSELALYIVPNINQIWTRLNEHAKQLHTSIGEEDDFSQKLVPPPMGLSQKFAVALQLNAAAKELKRIKKMKGEFKKFVDVGEYRRLQFVGLSDEEKVEKIKRGVQEMIHDGEAAVSRLEDLKKKMLLANVLDWASYKLGVSITCSYISWGLCKLTLLKEQLGPLAKRLSAIVASEEFNSIVVQLGLADPQALCDESQSPPTSAPLPRLSPGASSIGSVIPLVGGCMELLKTQELSDMVFVVQDLAPPTRDSTHNEDEREEVVIHAHRVILSARCEWFRRALQSGMIEDRDRKIIIKDVDVSLFRSFLEYLYGKPLDYANMNKEEIIELLAIADRYETSSLHSTCEQQLINRIDNSNVFSLLIVADQFSARQLRSSALQFIVDNPDVLIKEVEAYTDLPIELKTEVRQILSGTQELSQFRRGPQVRREEDDLANDRGFPSGEEVIDDLLSYNVAPTTSGLLSSLPDETVINSLLSDMRAIVGDEPTDERLKSLLIAADMDINRAINFFFGTE